MVKNLLYLALVGLGFLQMLGFVTKQKAIRGIGTVSVASPLPLVFTSVNGYETFSPDFYFEYLDPAGTWQEVKITPEIYSQLQAPYQYRNVLGAAISYGPVLPESLWQPILHYAFVDPGAALSILDLETVPEKRRILLKHKVPAKPSHHRLEIP
jgi:hypothetical protein